MRPDRVPDHHVQDPHPDEVRSRDKNVVELTAVKRGGDDIYEEWVAFNEDDLAKRAVPHDGGFHDGSRGYSVGYVVPPDLVDAGGGQTQGGIIIGTGVYAHGLGSWAPWNWGDGGLVQCEVRYSDDEPLNVDWDGMEAETGDGDGERKTRSTLLTRVCVRREGEGGPDRAVWEGRTFNDDGIWCADWGTTSTANGVFPFFVQCSLSGPSVRGIAPTEEQRERIGDGLRAALGEDGRLEAHDVLRASFHDAASYTPDTAALRGGARGCMRYEHVQGNAPNIGLAFLFDHLEGAVGCQPGASNCECLMS